MCWQLSTLALKADAQGRQQKALLTAGFISHLRVLLCPATGRKFPAAKAAKSISIPVSRVVAQERPTKIPRIAGHTAPPKVPARAVPQVKAVLPATNPRTAVPIRPARSLKAMILMMMGTILFTMTMTTMRIVTTVILIMLTESMTQWMSWIGKRGVPVECCRDYCKGAPVGIG